MTKQRVQCQGRQRHHSVPAAPLHHFSILHSHDNLHNSAEIINANNNSRENVHRHHTVIATIEHHPRLENVFNIDSEAEE